jgi:hypothetical protein
MQFSLFTQSTFVVDRHITDNVVIVYEILHTMKTCMKGKKGFMSLKLDMRRACDKVE